MGATTNYGRTRNRRAQALNTVLNGQAPTIYAFQCTSPSPGTISFNVWNADLVPYTDFANPPSPTLRVTVQTGSGLFFETVPFTVAGQEITFTVVNPPLSGDHVIILPWNESLRGANGEWLAGAVLEIP